MQMRRGAVIAVGVVTGRLVLAGSGLGREAPSPVSLQQVIKGAGAFGDRIVSCRGRFSFSVQENIPLAARRGPDKTEGSWAWSGRRYGRITVATYDPQVAQRRNVGRRPKGSPPGIRSQETTTIVFDGSKGWIETRIPGQKAPTMSVPLSKSLPSAGGRVGDAVAVPQRGCSLAETRAFQPRRRLAALRVPSDSGGMGEDFRLPMRKGSRSLGFGPGECYRHLVDRS